MYKQATGDFSLTQVLPSHSTITAYEGKSIPVAGIVRLKVWRREDQYKLDCKLVDSERV